MKSRLAIILLFVSFITGCSEKELPSGDIAGRVKLNNWDYSVTSDLSDVELKLFRDTMLAEKKFSSQYGTYLFEGQAYGKYRIEVSFEGYIPASIYSGGYSLYHIGGPGQTIAADLSLYQIPDFTITIDSIRTGKPYDNPVNIFLKINGDTLLPWASLIGFMSNSRDVSSENYVSIGKGGFRNKVYTSTGLVKTAVWGYLSILDSEIESLKSDSIFVRLYPVAGGQNMYKTVSMEALGPPSAVSGFIWK